MTESVSDKLETKELEGTQNLLSSNSIDSDVEQLKSRMEYLEGSMLEIEQCLKNIPPNGTAINSDLQKISGMSMKIHPRKHGLRHKNKNVNSNAEFVSVMQYPHLNCAQSSFQQTPYFCTNIAFHQPYFNTYPTSANHSNSNGFHNLFNFCLSHQGVESMFNWQTHGLVSLLDFRHPYNFCANRKKQTVGMRTSEGRNSSVQPIDYSIPGSYRTQQIFDTSSVIDNSSQQLFTNYNFSSSLPKAGSKRKLVTLGSNSVTNGVHYTCNISSSKWEKSNSKHPYAPGLFRGSKNSPWRNKYLDSPRARFPQKFGTPQMTSQQPCTTDTFSEKEEVQISMPGTPPKRRTIEKSDTCNSSTLFGATMFGPDNPWHPRQWFRKNSLMTMSIASSHESLGSRRLSAIQQSCIDSVNDPILQTRSSSEEKLSKCFHEVIEDIPQNSIGINISSTDR